MESTIVILVVALIYVALIFSNLWWLIRDLPEGFGDPVAELDREIATQDSINGTDSGEWTLPDLLDIG